MMLHTDMTKESPCLLAVLAHPDDESFLIGGVLRKHAMMGMRTELLCLTSGDRGMLGEPPRMRRSDLPAVRRAELRRACSCLGVSRLHLPGFPDGRLAEVGVDMLAAEVSRLVRAVSPQILITFEPEGIGNNPDHIATSLAATVAYRESHEMARLQVDFVPPRRLFYVVIPESESRLIGREVHSVRDDAVEVTVDISQQWEHKRAALLCHRSQARDILEVFGADFGGLSRREHFMGLPSCGRPHGRPFSDLFEAAQGNWSR